jgi:hypothetical protein
LRSPASGRHKRHHHPRSDDRPRMCSMLHLVSIARLQSDGNPKALTSCADWKTITDARLVNLGFQHSSQEISWLHELCSLLACSPSAFS